MALRQIVFILAVSTGRRFWFKAAGLLESHACLCSHFRSSGSKIILLRIAHIQKKTASHQRTEFPDENSTVLRKLLAAKVLALRAKAGTAVAYLFFPGFRDLMQALHFGDTAMNFLPISGTFLTQR